MSQLLDVKTFPLHGSHLIEASAGTGKTYTIALLYVRLVLGHGEKVKSAFSRPLTPPEILVVTFTDAASQELNDRIRARLTEAAEVFSGSRTIEKHDPLMDIVNDYKKEQHAACALQLQRAAEWMDEAAISTIHGWCYRMLREHAFDSNHLFTQELLTNESELLIEVVQDYWRQHFYAITDADVIAAIAAAFASPDELTKALKDIIAKDKLQPFFNGLPVSYLEFDAFTQEAGHHHREMQEWQQALDNLENAARACWKTHRLDIEAILREVKLNGNKYTRGTSVDGFFAQMQQWSEGGETPDKKMAHLAKEFPDKHQVFALLLKWVECNENKKPADPSMPLKTHLLLHAAQWVAATLQQRKENRAELGYNDMLKRLEHALEANRGERLAAVIRQQFPVAMIDEFQDTDPVQYGIFDKIYHIQQNNSETAFVMIGDPKQAIYSFRGADIYTYLDARKATEGRHHTLGKNFRSTQAVVETINHLFNHAEVNHDAGAFRFRNTNDKNDNPVPFEKAECKGRDEILKIDHNKVDALTCWYMQGENKHGVTGNRNYLHDISRVAASEIVRWLELAKNKKAGFYKENTCVRSLRPRDIAILVRTGKEAAAIRHELAVRGVNSVYLSDRDSVFASAEAKDILRWLQAVAEPGNERLLKPALATASLGLSLDALKNLVHTEVQWESEVMRFRGYKELWHKQGVLPMLSKLLADHHVPAQLLTKPNGERALTNVLHVAEWLQQESASIDGEQALIRLLAEKIAEPSDEDVLRLESDADLIKVVTIHASKGLEYPLVLLPFICSRRKIDGTTKLINYHEYDAESGCHETRTELGRNNIAEKFYDKADDERLSEDMRLLYVALTRAQHALWLGVTPVGKDNRSSGNFLHESALGYLLTGGQKIVSAQLQDKLNTIASGTDMKVLAIPEVSDERYQPEIKQDLNEARELNQPAASERWWVASYSALQTGELSQADIAVAPKPEPEPENALQSNLREEEENSAEFREATNDEKLSMHYFPKGSKPGTFLHSLLEKAAKDGFADTLKNAELQRDTIFRFSKRRGWEKWTDMLDLWIKKLLQAPLPVGTQSIRLADVSRCFPEMEFLFESHFVNTQTLDKLVSTHTLDQKQRPILLNNLMNGMLKGFIDLVFEYKDQYFVADWKSNHLGDSAAAYTKEAMCDAVLEKRYELQYTLYVLALHRHLKDRLPGYDYDKHIGGAVYVFLRGIENQQTHGVHFEKPSRTLIEALDHLFADTKAVELAV